MVAEPLTSLGFAPFGQVAFPEEDGAAFGPEDAQLDLSRGTPRFYLMRLRDKHMEFDTITYHEQCTQCLGALGSESWYMAVSQATHDVTQYPVGESIKVFEIPPGAMDFYNLELSDTNQVDHNCHEYGTGDGFEVVGSSVMK